MSGNLYPFSLQKVLIARFLLLVMQEILASVFSTGKFPAWATMWQTELRHFIKTAASFVTPSARMQWRRLCCEASVFVFINHAAKTAYYTCNNQCDVPDGLKKEDGKMKWKNEDSLPPIVIHGTLMERMIRGILFVQAYNYTFEQR